MTNICKKGKWKVMVNRSDGSADSVQSDCFICPGDEIFHSFDLQVLEINVSSVLPFLITWDLTIYKTKRKENYFSCDSHTTKKEILARQFQNTYLQPQQIEKKYIKLRHDFDAQACYCIVMTPIRTKTLLPQYIPLTTNSCRPIKVSSNRRVTQIDRPLPITELKVFGMVLVIMILVVLIFAGILGKPLFLSKILGLRRQTAWQESPSRKSMLSRNAAVLLLYAEDVSGSEHLTKLKHHLQAAFTVHDLFDCNDTKRLADSSGWTEEMLMPNSGVKLMLVESVGLVGMIKDLLNPYPGTAKVTQTSLQAQTAKNLLTFALRTIVCTDLQADYSTVFIVRFSDEVMDVADLLVYMRRYKFPDHFSELTEAMQEACV